MNRKPYTRNPRRSSCPGPSAPADGFSRVSCVADVQGLQRCCCPGPQRRLSVWRIGLSVVRLLRALHSPATPRGRGDNTPQATAVAPTATAVPVAKRPKLSTLVEVTVGSSRRHHPGLLLSICKGAGGGGFLPTTNSQQYIRSSRLATPHTWFSQLSRPPPLREAHA